ncbi:MAG TPA: hypothetical protein VFH37_01430 [Candidatus Saccharimonadales bacterium]|nr:hypothetical protein [Candidatus Saccharimonadales bacterium]
MVDINDDVKKYEQEGEQKIEGDIKERFDKKDNSQGQNQQNPQ